MVGSLSGRLSSIAPSAGSAPAPLLLIVHRSIGWLGSCSSSSRSSSSVELIVELLRWPVVGRSASLVALGHWLCRRLAALTLIVSLAAPLLIISLAGQLLIVGHIVGRLLIIGSTSLGSAPRCWLSALHSSRQQQQQQQQQQP